MKKMLLASAAVATMIASPALAQSSWQSGSIPAAPFYGQVAPHGQVAPFGAYAQQRPGAFVTPYAQHLGGDYVGTDPDPTVRLQLRKDAESRD
jgi:hypothetical protein